MPTGFLASLTEKAQSLAQASPLAGKIPGTTAPEHSAASTEGQTSSSSGGRGHTFGALQHQLRQFGQQYSSASPVQKIITTSKGVSIDFDSVSRDAHGQSKELYLWGQTEGEDLKDVTDRLAFVNYVHGSLAQALATKLNDSREPIKALRDAETTAGPRRQARTAIETQIARVEHAQDKGSEGRLSQLREQLSLAEQEAISEEKEIEVLKRKAVKESEIAKWEALREYGEKLVLLSQAATVIASALPTTPVSATSPYKGAQTTAGARASLQRALDNYRTGSIHLPAHADSIDSASVASFGETHGPELARINPGDFSSAAEPNLPKTPTEAAPGTFAPPAGGPPPTAHPHAAVHFADTKPPASMPIPSPALASTHAATVASPASPAVDPLKLNMQPAPLPTSPDGSSTVLNTAVAAPVDPEHAPIAGMTPTMAETGVPVSAGGTGPGPATGSLSELRKERFGGDDVPPPAATGSYGAAPPAFGAAVAGAGIGHHESADEEKARLQREERERVLGGATTHQAPAAPAAAPKYESGDDEKKRLEREERERVLAAGGTQGTQGGANLGRSGTVNSKGEDLPPYQEPF